MKRTIGFALALGLAVSVAGCASQGGGGGAGAPSAAASTGGTTATTEAAGSVRDFNLRVRCPGIHLEKTKLGWSDEKIMEHENVSKDDIGRCEAWAAAQPKGYVPPPPPGVKPKTAAQAKN
jgi:hypothetical protein